MSYQGNHERGAVSYIVASLGQRKPEAKKKKDILFVVFWKALSVVRPMV